MNPCKHSPVHYVVTVLLNRNLSALQETCHMADFAVTGEKMLTGDL